ncbi:2'-5' RNA ligase family protein [Streptomyces sp. NPDC058534]|uniref:2'-5' RNA ligase family protein n=1 Tax=Streptomyces sp. NPDC058534 TaxID=3346541 RepID=UPI00364F341B
MESFFSQKRTWANGPYLHFIAVLDDPAYVAFTQAHHDLLADYGDRVGIVPAPWLHWTAQGVHHQLAEDQVERAVRAAREAARQAAPATVTMGPVWPGPSAVTVAMYPEEPLAEINALVRNAVSTVPGVQLREAGDRYWPHSTLAYYRSPSVHDADFNRRLRNIRPQRAEITIRRLLAVYMHQDLNLGYYTWTPIAEIPLGVTAADAAAPEVVCGAPESTATYRSAPPWGDPDAEYEIEVGRLAVQPPLSDEQVRYESFVSRALDDSTYFDDGEPPLPKWPDPVTTACERPVGDGACGSTRLRVRGSWTRPAVIICEHGHSWTDTVETMREVILAAEPAQ